MSIQDKLKKYDKISIGLITGLILPLLGFVISYFIKAAPVDVTFHDYFFSHLLHSPDKIDIIIFSMIPNMFLFYFVNFKWAMYEFTKGIVGITLLMGVLVVIVGV